MRCKNCNVEIACKSSVCPLCHKPLVSDGEVPFPTPATKKILMGKFSLAYLVIAVIANIVCITLNFVLTPKVLWCVPVLVSFIYVFYFVSVTVLAKRGFHKRILGQALILTAVFAAIKLAIGGNHWIFISWLPAVYLVSDLLMLIFIFKKKNEASKYIATLLLLCIFGAIPCISAYVFDLSVKLPSIIATSVSAAIFIICLIVCRKTIIHELKKVFNL